MRVSDPLLAAESLARRFGPVTAVSDISFMVERGEVLGFLGPNGAGKSTTMRMIAGFIAPSAGTARVCGHDVVEDPVAAKAALGYLPEGAPLYPDMTPLALLRFVGGVRGLRGRVLAEAVERAVDRTALDSVLRRPIEQLSKGFKRRVGLAQALLHDPPVLILDEPTDGLDPNQKHGIRALIRALAPDKAIVISTHILEEVETVCSRALVIAEGRVIADGTPADLAQSVPDHNGVWLTLEADDHDEVCGRLAEVDGVAGIRIERTEPHLLLFATARDETDIAEPLRAEAEAAGWAIEDLRVHQGTLDDVFRGLTGAGHG